MSIAERREYQREVRQALAEQGVLHEEEPACRECGCSDQVACEGGCWWVQADLCNLCAAELEGGGL